MLKIAFRAALVVAFVLPAASPAWAGTPQGPTPLGNPGNWVTSDDYPSAALRYEVEGIVGFQLMIDPLGVPSSCLVTQTSQSEDLDVQTCDLLMQRARFHPATNAKGKPVDGSYRSSVRWVIPDEASQDGPNEIGPAELEFSFVVGSDGLAKQCLVEKVTGKFPFLVNVSECGAKERFAIPTGKDGKPISRRARVRMTVEVEDLP